MNPVDEPTMGEHLEQHPEDGPCTRCRRDPDLQPYCAWCGGDGRRGVEIQPCPLCESYAYQFSFGGSRGTNYWIRCTLPYCLSGPVRLTPHEARAAWNRLRVEEES